jgi:hypothetical protein
MPIKTPPASPEAPLSVEPTPRKTFTNWDAFVKAKIIPTTIICDVIHMHPADEACKTRMPLEAKNMIRHFEIGHGGGFQVKVKQSDGRPWPGWKDLENAGYEIVNMKCEVCDRKVQVSPRDILNHLRTHQGKFRGAFQNYKDTFFIQIQSQPPVEDYDEFSEDTE